MSFLLVNPGAWLKSFFFPLEKKAKDLLSIPYRTLDDWDAQATRIRYVMLKLTSCHN